MQTSLCIDWLIIGNGQDLSITYVGDSFFTFKFKDSKAKHNHIQIALKNIPLVPLLQRTF